MEILTIDNGNFMIIILSQITNLLSKCNENDIINVYKINIDILETELKQRNIPNIYIFFSDIILYKKDIPLKYPVKMLLVNKFVSFIKIANDFIKTEQNLYKPYFNDDCINLGFVFKKENKNIYCVINKDKLNNILNKDDKISDNKIKINNYNSKYVNLELSDKPWFKNE